MRQGRAWPRCANCHKATYYCAKHGCNTTASARATSGAESSTPVTETISLKPRGMETPEGEQRVAKALKAFEESHPTVANAATQFITKYLDEIKAVVVRTDEPDAVEDFEELLELIEQRRVAQEQFLRAVAGVPPMGGTR